MPELLALRPSNRRRVLVPLNESNVYERVERGLSSAHTRGIDHWGIEPNSRQTLRMSSCDLGTKSSLGLNCYFTAVYISTKPTLGVVLLASPVLLVILHMYTRALSISTLPQSIVLLALRQRYISKQESSQRVPGMATRICTIPYLYSRQSRRHKALRNVPRVRA